MNNKENDPDNLGGLGDMLPVEVLKKLNELLERLNQAESNHHGSTVINVYEKGSLHVDYVEHLDACYQRDARKGEGKGTILPEALSTDEAMALWRKAQEAGYVDENYQPKISRTQAALLADAMAERLGIRNKWKVFEKLWNRTKMYKDYYEAVEQKQYLPFLDKLKQVFPKDGTVGM